VIISAKKYFHFIVNLKYLLLTHRGTYEYIVVLSISISATLPQVLKTLSSFVEMCSFVGGGEFMLLELQH
jgi:hypothetical protein